MPQPQIIAKQGIILGRSPNPDHGLPWQGDQWFPEDDTTYNAQIAAIRARDYLSLYEQETRLEAKMKSIETATLILRQQEKAIEEKVRRAEETLRTRHPNPAKT